MEDAAEVCGDAVSGLREGGRRSLRGFEFERGDRAVRDAAGDDEREVAEVGADVEREAVRGDELRDVNADGGDFLFGDVAAGERPDAGALADALRGDSEIFAGEDQRFFDEADEVDWAEVRAFFPGKVSAEIEDGITDELAGAVIGDVSATFGLVDFDVLGGELGICGEDVGARGVATEREDGRVLEKEKCVCDEAGFARGDDFGLEAEAFGVGDATEMKEVEDAGIISDGL